MSKVSSETTRLCWNGLLDTSQVHNLFTHTRNPRFSWCNGLSGKVGRLARFMRFYIPGNRGDDIINTSYFICGHFVGSDLSHVQLKLCISFEDIRKSPFKKDVSHLSGDYQRNLDISGEAFLGRPHFSSNSCNSLGSLDVVVNVKAKESKKEEMDVQGKLETTTTTLHDNVTTLPSEVESTNST